MTEDATATGHRLAEARLNDQLTQPIDPALIPDVDRAYALQRAAIEALGHRRIGWKLGATGAVSQQRLALAGPFHAPMFEPYAAASGGEFKASPGLRGVEVELAFRMGRDLPARPGGYPATEVAAAVESLHPALEVVASREERSDLQGLNAIADFGLNAAFAYGPPIAEWGDLDLPAVRASCLVDGQSRAEGDASAVLGNPLLALAWLTEQGVGLAAGDWVSTGTLTGITPAGSGQSVVGDFGRLGRVELRFV